MSAGKRKNVYYGYTQHNKVKLVRGGKTYFDLLLQMIHKAKDTIHLQVYIFDDDETGKEIAEALIAAASRNVKVYLLVDGYASQVMSKSFIRRLQHAGIHFRFFEPLFKSRYFYFGRRLHHKLVVADARVAMVGGINITNRYNDMPGQPAWLDFALYAEGEIARELCVLCRKTWSGFPAAMKVTPCEKEQISFNFKPEENSWVRMRRNDWVRKKYEVSRSYEDMFRNAASHITILSSYFLPGSVFRRTILKAVKRGVRIKIIAAGLSDVKLAKYGERYLYDWLMKNGIEIYEYQKNILHGKIAVCDSEWLTIGSYNVNNISAYASIELNLDVRNPGFAASVEKKLEEIITKECIYITEERLRSGRNIFKRFIQWASYEIICIIFYLFTFYFKQHK